MLVLCVPGDFLRGGVRLIVGVIGVVGPGGGVLSGQAVKGVFPRGQHYPNLRSEPAFKLVLRTETSKQISSRHTNTTHFKWAKI